METKINCITVGDIKTNCWLYPLEDEGTGRTSCIVIDPGDEAANIASRLDELKWAPRYIFLTHGHIDHLAALPDLLKALAGDAREKPRTGIHRLDACYLGKDSLAAHRRSFSAAGGDPAYVEALWKPLPDADFFYDEGDSAGPFRVLHLPGHSPGSVGLYDEKAGILFSGDTLFRGTWGRTYLPGGSDAQMHQSLERLLSMKGEITVCPGHGPATTIKDETGLMEII